MKRREISVSSYDDQSHYLHPHPYTCFRARSTPLEHDVLLPRDAKDAGVPHTPSWDGESVLPRTTSIRLRAGECFIRSGITIHRGHAQRGERLTLAGAAVLLRS